jgi:hypothetical protein
MPIGGNFAIVSYIHSGGNILLDNTLPIEDLNAKLNNFAIGYVRSFKLFNKLAKFDAIIPYANGNFNALLDNEDGSTSRHGFGDPFFRLSLILIGVKPLTPGEFFKQESKKFKLGVIFRFKAPLGEYDPDKLINLGANRWAFKTGLAGSYTIRKKIVLEAQLNSWFFTENNDFFGGKTIDQKPLLETQLHVTYIFKPGIWLSISTGNTYGGKTEINGVEQEAIQNNSRYGFAFGYRINKNHGLKIAYSNGLTIRNGTNFNILALAYQFMWFDKK